jgi:hypothetical protein
MASVQKRDGPQTMPPSITLVVHNKSAALLKAKLQLVSFLLKNDFIASDFQSKNTAQIQVF